MFSVMRHPVLMEDEGRIFHIIDFQTEQEAKDWIAQQKGEYHPPGDYFIMTDGYTNKKKVNNV